MQPESSRLNHYKRIKNLNKKKQYNVYTFDKIDFTVDIVYNNPNFIDYEIINKVIKVIDIVSMTIGDKSINYYVKNLTFHIIDKYTIFIVLDVKEEYRGIFFGRKMANIFAMKRLFSNISATASKKTDNSIAITMHHITGDY